MDNFSKTFKHEQSNKQNKKKLKIITLTQFQKFNLNTVTKNHKAKSSFRALNLTSNNKENSKQYSLSKISLGVNLKSTRKAKKNTSTFFPNSLNQFYIKDLIKENKELKEEIELLKKENNYLKKISHLAFVSINKTERSKRFQTNYNSNSNSSNLRYNSIDIINNSSIKRKIKKYNSSNINWNIKKDIFNTEFNSLNSNIETEIVLFDNNKKVNSKNNQNNNNYLNHIRKTKSDNIVTFNFCVDEIENKLKEIKKRTNNILSKYQSIINCK